MGWSDVHAHLTHPVLAPREGELLANARAAGVTAIVTNGLNPEDNDRVRALAAREPIVRPALGLYPVDAVSTEMEAMGVGYPRETPSFTAEEGIASVRDHAEEAFAIGEIGLDGHWVPEALWERQEAVFRALVEIALAADKPMIIHTRKREQRALEVLREMGASRVLWHCFGGKVKLARRIAEEGHWLSIPANARRNEAFTRMLTTLPRDKILLETDCPYLGPDRDRDNEPANVARTAEYAAELWSSSLDAVRERIEDNFEALFRARP